MKQRRTGHRRRRRRLLLVVVLAVALLGGAAGLVGFRVLNPGQRFIRVTVLVDGIPRPVRVAEPATVASALEAGRVVPRAGQLLSVVTSTVLDAALNPPQLLLDGLPTSDEAPVLAGAILGVVEHPDVVEGQVDAFEVIPAPPMPQVINGLWHPGQPGQVVNRKGALSGELVAQQVLQAAVRPVPVTAKLVALTFDDGPWGTTPEILRVLREKNVKATFCVVTRQMKGPNLDIVKGAVAEGHHLCNHTVSHDAGLPKKSSKVVESEIKGANQQLLERTGVKPAYYRPPGGRMGPNIEAVAKSEGQQVLMWTVDTKDFTKPPPEAIVATVMANVQPGGVVLMHDGGGDRAATIAALPALIDQLRGAGYELVLPDDVPPVPAAPVVPVALPA